MTVVALVLAWVGLDRFNRRDVQPGRRGGDPGSWTSPVIS